MSVVPFSRGNPPEKGKPEAEIPKPAPTRYAASVPESRTNVWLVLAVSCCVVLVGVVGFLLGRGKAPVAEAPPVAQSQDLVATKPPVRAPEPEPQPQPVAPRVEPEWQPAEPLPPVVPTSPGGTFGFDDIEQVCGDLASLPNYLCLLNRGSEVIAGGARLVIDERLASFTGRGGFGNAVSIDVAGKERYSLSFGPPKGKALIPGHYSGAVRWPFNDGPYPGIDVTVGSSGCNTEDGQFRILQVQVSGDRVLRFVADFETTCNGAIGRISVGRAADQGIEIRRSEPKSSLPVT